MQQPTRQRPVRTTRIAEVFDPFLLRAFESLYKVLVTRQFLQPVPRDRLEYRPRISRYFPPVAVERLPKMIGPMTPDPAEIQGQISERLQFRR